MEKLVSEIRHLDQQCRNKLTTGCYQVKVIQTTDIDFAEVIRIFEDRKMQPVLDEINLIEDQWRTLDLWEILHSVNPRPLIEFGSCRTVEQDRAFPDDEYDNAMLFRRSIISCGIFDDLVRKLGWKVGVSIDIEEDICDVVGKLMMKVANRSSVLNFMQTAMMNIQVMASEGDCDNLMTLLNTTKKYNGLNLACILLEQMIIDNKGRTESLMRSICAEFIDLAVQLIIGNRDYRDDILWNLNYLLKLESVWHVEDIYNLMKNGLLMFYRDHKKFHRYLMIIRNFALYPSLKIRSIEQGTHVVLKDILSCRDENQWSWIEKEVYEEEPDKSIDQVLGELKEDEVDQTEKELIKQIITKSQTIMSEYNDFRDYSLESELIRIRTSKQKDGIDGMSYSLALLSMALYKCKKFWPLNTQLVSYCVLVSGKAKNKGRLLEILTGEGKSCVIAMVAATYALQGRTVDIVTSSPVLSHRDAEEWRNFYTTLKLGVGCNVEDKTEEDSQCYKCSIVYGTVETFARDILKTEFLLQNVRMGRKYDIVIVDEVDSMLIDQGLQCTYLSPEVASIGMRHFEPILGLIWMHVSKFELVFFNEKCVFYQSEPEVFFITLSRMSKEIDPLQILRLAEEEDGRNGIKKGFTDEYLSKDIEDQTDMLITFDSGQVAKWFEFVRKFLNMDFDIYQDFMDMCNAAESNIQQNVSHRSRLSVLATGGPYSTMFFNEDLIKDCLTKMIIDVILDENENKIDLPLYLREYCIKRVRYWIDNAFQAKNMQPNREYIVKGNAIYPVDYKSTGVIETNKKWGDGLHQFLEMKHGLPTSPLFLITNFLSNIEFFDRYGCNIIGVSGTLGNDAEKKFMHDTFSVEFATIPTSKRRKLFEIDGEILEDENELFDRVYENVESALVNKRAVVVICEDVETAIRLSLIISSCCKRSEQRDTKRIPSNVSCLANDRFFGDHMSKELKPGDVIVSTNLGARGADFVLDDNVNKNGGLFLLATFLPLNDRVEKQAFGRTGRRGATGSCQIILNRSAMPELLRSSKTVDEAKRLRDSIEMHRLNNTTKVNLMRNNQKLFREYCKSKIAFNNASADDWEDLRIQVEILDETWANWIQNYGTVDYCIKSS